MIQINNLSLFPYLPIQADYENAYDLPIAPRRQNSQKHDRSGMGAQF